MSSDHIKASLGNSAKMLAGTGTGSTFILPASSTAHPPAEPGSCCDDPECGNNAPVDEKTQDQPSHHLIPYDENEDEECDHDNTSPGGGCGCC